MMITNMMAADDHKDLFAPMGSCDGKQFNIICGATIDGVIIDLLGIIRDWVSTDIDIEVGNGDI